MKMSEEKCKSRIKSDQVGLSRNKSDRVGKVGNPIKVRRKVVSHIYFLNYSKLLTHTQGTLRLTLTHLLASAHVSLPPQQCHARRWLLAQSTVWTGDGVRLGIEGPTLDALLRTAEDALGCAARQLA